MNTIKEFLESEKSEFQTLYYELTNAIYELKDLLPKDEVNKRAFISKTDSIKKYIDNIDDINYKYNKLNFLSQLTNSSKLKIELLEFKKTLQHDIRFAKKCVKCKCLTCKESCTFNSCKNCNLSEIVKSCDTSEKCIYHGLKNVLLYHHETDTDIDFIVLGRLVYKTSEYLLLKNSDNEDDLQLYRYSVESNGQEHFDTLSESEIDEIWDIFVNMGIGR